MSAILLAPPVASTPRLTLVKDRAALDGLRPCWEQLLDESAASEPAQHPDWLLPWLDIYGAGRELCVGLFRAGAEPIGLAPLSKRRVWYRPGIPFRRLEFLGADVAEGDGVCSEYLNVIAQAG